MLRLVIDFRDFVYADLHPRRNERLIDSDNHSVQPGADRAILATTISPYQFRRALSTPYLASNRAISLHYLAIGEPFPARRARRPAFDPFPHALVHLLKQRART